MLIPLFFSSALHHFTENELAQLRSAHVYVLQLAGGTTWIQQMVDTSSPARSFKAWLRNSGSDIVSKASFKKMYDVCRRYSNPHAFERCGFYWRKSACDVAVSSHILDLIKATMIKEEDLFRRKVEDIMSVENGLNFLEE
jgi:hypothetical protein